MRTASAELQALLGGRRFLQADLYSFGLTDGTTLQYTSWDQNLGAFSSGLGWERTQWKLSTGLGVDTMDITLHATPLDLVSGIPVIDSISQGFWDGAQCKVERAFMATPGSVAGTIIIFLGQIGTINEIGRIHCKMTLTSKTALLNVGMPKALFQPSCRHTLYDAGCTLNRASFTTTGAVASGSTTSVIKTGTTQSGGIPGPTLAPVLSTTTQSGVFLPPFATYFVVATYTTAEGESLASPESSLLVAATNALLGVASPAAAAGATGWNVYIGASTGDGQLQNTTPLAIGANFTMAPEGIYLSGIKPPEIATNGFFALGVIKFTSGVNAGLSRVVESSDAAGNLTLRIPLPIAPTAGDTFSVVAGCDHTMSTCASSKFQNLTHFGGQPYTPVAEMGA